MTQQESICTPSIHRSTISVRYVVYKRQLHAVTKIISCPAVIPFNVQRSRLDAFDNQTKFIQTKFHVKPKSSTKATATTRVHLHLGTPQMTPYNGLEARGVSGSGGATVYMADRLN